MPFTSGILIGIGETRLERIDVAARAARRCTRAHGHLQEIIVQNFRAKPGTRMAGCAEPDLDDLLWTAAAARLIFGPAMNIQVPPNLSYERLSEAARRRHQRLGRHLAGDARPRQSGSAVAAPRSLARGGDRGAPATRSSQRLAIYPDYRARAGALARREVCAAGAGARSTRDGFARGDAWSPGTERAAARRRVRARRVRETTLDRILRASAAPATRLDEARDRDACSRRAAPPSTRSARRRTRCARTVSGDVVALRRQPQHQLHQRLLLSSAASAPSRRASGSEHLRGPPYDLALDEVARRAEEAWERGATEVCMQGGIHPALHRRDLSRLLRAVKAAVPRMHVHAFSPLEVTHGARTLGIPVAAFLEQLQATPASAALPGTAAEILDDEVRGDHLPRQAQHARSGSK